MGILFLFWFIDQLSKKTVTAKASYKIQLLEKCNVYKIICCKINGIALVEYLESKGFILCVREDAALSVGNVPVVSTVCGGSWLPAVGGAGLHVPSERPSAGSGQPGLLQLVVPSQPRPPAVTAHRQEIQPTRSEE